MDNYSYADLKAALQSHATTSADQTALKNLPATDITNGQGFDLVKGYAKMLGLYTKNDDLDNVSLNNLYSFSFGQDVIATMEHEITEQTMGRYGYLGTVGWGAMDLFRFESDGTTRDLSGANSPTYFAIGDGTVNTSLPYYTGYDSTGKAVKGDYYDWSVGTDAFGSGVVGDFRIVSPTDLEIMDVLGWTPLAESWNTTGGAFWNTAGDWTEGVPGYGYEITINQGAPEVAYNQGEVFSLSIGFAGSLTLGYAGALTVTTAVTNTGNLDVQASASLIAQSIDNIFDLTVANSASLTTTGALTNEINGVVSIDQNDNGYNPSVHIGATLTNLGDLSIGPTDGSLGVAVAVEASALVNQGTLDIFGGTKGASLYVDYGTGSGVDNTLTGTIGLIGDAILRFTAGGPITTISGSLTLSGSNAHVQYGTLLATDALGSLSTLSGYLGLLNGASVTSTGTLTNTGSAFVDSGSALSISGALYNQGSLSIGYSSNTGANTVSVGALYNYTTGSIALVGGTGSARLAESDKLTNYGSITETGASTIALTSVVYNFGTIGLDAMSGATGGSTLSDQSTFYNEDILDIGASSITTADTVSVLALVNASDDTIALTGGTAKGMLSVAGNFTNSGTLTESRNAEVDVSGNLFNDGTVSLDTTSATGGSSLTVDGTFNNYGQATVDDTEFAADSFSVFGLDNASGATISLNGSAVPFYPVTFDVTGAIAGSAYNAGTINALTATIQIDGALTGGGTINLQGNDTLELENASDNTISFANFGNLLKIDNPYAGFTGTISDLEPPFGETQGDTIDLVGVQVTAAALNASETQMSVTFNGDTVQYKLAGVAANSGLIVRPDGNGGTFINVAPELHWKTAANGYYYASNWTPNAIPDIDSIAAIDAAGAAYTVTVQANYGSAEADELDVAKNATVAVSDDAFLDVGEVIRNAGKISLQSSGSETGLLLGNGPEGNGNPVYLEGGGEIALSNNAENVIEPENGNSSLVNVDNTIIGAGSLSIDVTNESAGTIQANDATALTLLGTDPIVNAGLLADSGTGGLVIASASTISGGGRIQANGSGSHVDFGNSVTFVGETLLAANGGAINFTSQYYDAATIQGGTLSTTNGGTLNFASSLTLDGSTSAGAVTINTTQALVASSVLGSITFASDGSLADTGGFISLGSIVKSGGTGVSLFAPNAARINLVDGPVSVASGTLEISDCLYDNTISGAGTFELAGASGFDDGTTLAVAHLAIAGGASLSISDGMTYAGSLTMAAGSTLSIAELETTTFSGSKTLNGTINVSSYNALTTNLVLAGATAGTGTVALGGEGTVEFGGASTQTVTFAGGNNTLKIDAPASFTGTISGIGVGNGDTIDLAGVTVTSATLNAADTQLTLTRSGGANLVYKVANIAAGTGFLFQSDGHGGTDLMGAPVIGWASATDGDWDTNTNWNPDTVPSSNAIAQLAATGASYTVSTSDDDGAGLLSLVSTATLAIGDATFFSVNDAIRNAGTIDVGSTGDETDLLLGPGTVALTGGGRVTLSDDTANAIDSNYGAATLDNVDNTISGGGTIGVTGLSAIVNETAGKIIADGGAGIDIGNVASIANSGLLADTGSGGLEISRATITGTGTIEAVGAGAHVDLSGDTIQGGTLKTTTGGVLKVSGKLDGSTTAGAITLSGAGRLLGTTQVAGTLVVSGASTIALASGASGTLVNAGTIDKTGAGTAAVSAPVTNNGLIKTDAGAITFSGGLTNVGIIQGVVTTSGTQSTVAADASGQTHLTGGSGNNRFVIATAPTVIDGGAGTDTVEITASMTLAAGSLVSVEDVQVDNGLTIDLSALAPAETIQIVSLAGSGDTVKGTKGGDTFISGAGNDTMTGGAGNDTYFVHSAADQVSEATNGGADLVIASVSYTLATSTSVENLWAIGGLAGTTAINLTGNSLANSINGDAAANVLNGGAGADTLQGGSGNDTYYVDNAADQVIEAANGGTDLVIASVSYALTPGTTSSVESLWAIGGLTGTSAINLTGNGLANTLIGNAAANILNGGGGADTMQGGAGNDTYYVDTVSDKIIEATGGGTDTVLSSGSYVLQAGVSVEVLETTGGTANTAAINFNGNAFAQTIDGDAGNNVIDGKGGNDTLMGYGGHDTFLFDTAPNTTTNDPTIGDFSLANDMIELSHVLYTALTAGNLPSNQFSIGTAATSATDHIIYNSGTGALLYDADGNGAGAAVQFAKLSTGLTALSASNFKVI